MADRGWTVGYAGGSELYYREGGRLLRFGAERGPGDAVVLYVRGLVHWTEPADLPLAAAELGEIVRRIQGDLAGSFEVYVDA